ncbi:hypothetical protein evm_000952 [Chilo suppressalis]|nr:hypothetical protein evm_000952 [Chilo suppressalis]
MFNEFLTFISHISATPAYLKFSGPMLEAFLILTDSMTNRGDEQLLSHGKFQQTYKDGATELKQTPDFEATDYDSTLANQLNQDLSATSQANTPPELKPSMKEIIDICSNFLAQNAEFNKDKGPAFKLLVKSMKTKAKDQLYEKGKARRTFGKAAIELERAKGLESDHDDPNLSQEIHSALSKTVQSVTPDELKADMTESLDVCSKFLSQCATDEIERGPAFDLLIKELEKHGSDQFTPQFDTLINKFPAAYTLKSAPGLSSVTPDPQTAPIFKKALEHAVQLVTPNNLKEDMEGVIERCSNYLSAFVRDRGRAMEILLKSMKKSGKKELTKRNNHTMDYANGAHETENAPTLVPFLPVKDIANEVKGKLAKDVESSTPNDLKIAMKSLVQDVGRHLSQGVALKSGIAGDRYPLNFLTAIKKSLGTRPLYKYKSYGQTYGDAADELKYAGVLESDHGNEELRQQITAELEQGIPTQLTTTVTQSMQPIIMDVSKHLAKIGTEKGKALDYVVKVMREEGDAPMEQLQGYMQSYNDGARRIENAPSLTNDKVDNAAYESVKGKITSLTEKKPEPEHMKHLPGLIEDSAKFLSAPFPESEADKRRVLADLMARKGDNLLGQEADSANFVPPKSNNLQ